MLRCFYKYIGKKGKHERRFVMGSVAKIGQAAKFLFNRMRGVKYGGVKFGNGQVQLVPANKLRKLDTVIAQNHGECFINMPSEKVNEILRFTKPLQKGSPVTVSGESFNYLNVHGGLSIYNNQTKEAVLNICEKLKHPVKTYLLG